MKLLSTEGNLNIVEKDLSDISLCEIIIPEEKLDLPLGNFREWISESVQPQKTLLVKLCFRGDVEEYYEFLATTVIHCLIGENKKEEYLKIEAFRKELTENVFLPLSTLMKILCYENKVENLNIQIYENRSLYWEMVNNEK